MRIQVITIGKIKEEFLRKAEAEYIKRLPRELKVDFLELTVKGTASSESETMKKEAEAILPKVKSTDFLVALSERGKLLNSIEFSKFLQDRSLYGSQTLTFALSGAFGWDKSVLDRANLVLSLSPLTFPHQVARMLLIEQIYRGYTIWKGLPYQK